MSAPTAIVLLSGGLDSAVTLALARAMGFETIALSFQYGQRHAVELDSAKTIATTLGAAAHFIMPIDLRLFGGSALTSDAPVPKDRSQDDMSHGIPSTYVPARNTIFLSFALALAEVRRANDIFIGVNALDYSGYPDCRPEFIAAFTAMANLATKAGVEGDGRVTIHAPLINLTKAQIIEQGFALGVDFAQTSSCYDPAPNGAACGRCDSCSLRLKGFREVGRDDPRRYVWT